MPNTCISKKISKTEKTKTISSLAQLRTEQSFTQRGLSQLMCITQPTLSKFEKQEDMLISSLRKYVETLGGHLEINVKFGDSFVNLAQFGSAERK